MGLRLDEAGELLTKRVPARAFLYDDIQRAAHLRLCMTDSDGVLLRSPRGISGGRFMGGNVADVAFWLERRCERGCLAVVPVVGGTRREGPANTLLCSVWHVGPE